MNFNEWYEKYGILIQGQSEQVARRMYDAAFANGRTEGYEVGHADGFEVGYDSGYEVASERGY